MINDDAHTSVHITRRAPKSNKQPDILSEGVFFFPSTVFISLCVALYIKLGSTFAQNFLLLDTYTMAPGLILRGHGKLSEVADFLYSRAPSVSRFTGGTHIHSNG